MPYTNSQRNIFSLTNHRTVWLKYHFFLVCFFIFYLFIYFYFWLHWVFIAVHRLSLVASRGAILCCSAGLLIARRVLFLRSTGSRRMRSVVVACGLQSTGSVVVAHGLSCSSACGIFPDQGSNPCPLHWQVDS